VRARVHLLLGQRHQGGIARLEHQGARRPGPLRVDALSDEQRPRLLLQRHRLHAAGEIGQSGSAILPFPPRFPGPTVRQRLTQRRDVLRAGPAATAYRADTPRHELRHRRGEGLRRQRVHRLPADVLRHPGVGHHADGPGAERDQPPDSVAHFLRAGRTVHAKHVHGQRGERHRRRGDVRAGQQPAARVERHLRLQRHPQAQASERAPDALDRGLEFEEVLLRLEQHHVHPALEQPLRRLSVDVHQQVEARRRRALFQRKEPSRRPQGPRHEARRPRLRRDPVGDAARQLCSAAVELHDQVRHTKLRQRQPIGAEGIRLHRLSAGREIRPVRRLDELRAMQQQHLVQALGARPPKIRRL